MVKNHSKGKLARSRLACLSRGLRLQLIYLGHDLADLGVNGAGLGFFHLIGKTGIGENLTPFALQLLELAP